MPLSSASSISSSNLKHIPYASSAPSESSLRWVLDGVIIPCSAETVRRHEGLVGGGLRGKGKGKEREVVGEMGSRMGSSRSAGRTSKRNDPTSSSSNQSPPPSPDEAQSSSHRTSTRTRNTPRKSYIEPPLDVSDLVDWKTLVREAPGKGVKRKAVKKETGEEGKVFDQSGRLGKSYEKAILKRLQGESSDEEDVKPTRSSGKRQRVEYEESEEESEFEVTTDEDDEDYKIMDESKSKTSKTPTKGKTNPHALSPSPSPFEADSLLGPPLIVTLNNRPFRVDREQLDYFFYWCTERDKILQARLQGKPAPWSSDPVFNMKFSNLYRHQDRVSQYMLKEVVNGYKDDTLVDCVFRVLLFSAFDRISTWEALTSAFGDIRWASYDEAAFAEVLAEAKERNGVVFTGAYQVHPDKRWGSKLNYVNALRAVERMMKDGLPEKLSRMRSFKEAYDALHSYWGMGPFHSNQRCLDLEYTHYINLSTDYIVCGPGAIDGNRLIFPGLPRSHDFQFAACQWLVANQEPHWLRLGYKPFRGCREPGVDLVDVEHALCEVQGAVRELGNLRRAGGGKAGAGKWVAMAGKLPALVLPDKWRMKEEEKKKRGT